MNWDAIWSALLSASVALNIGLLVRSKNMAELRAEFVKTFGEINVRLTGIETALGDTEDHGLRGRVETIAARSHRAEAVASTAMTKVEQLENRLTRGRDI